MCGIFGIIYNEENKIRISSLVNSLGINSERRGKDASGLAFQDFRVFKSNLPFNETFNQTKIKSLFSLKTDFEIKSIIGHTRLATNGSASDDVNNQPVQFDEIIGIHNGIICNTKFLSEQYNLNSDIRSELDSEVLFLAIKKEFHKNQEETDLQSRWNKTLKNVYSKIEGSASIAILTKSGETILATNTGSLYIVRFDNYLLFSSERLVLEDTIQEFERNPKFKIEQIKPFSVVHFTINGKIDYHFYSDKIESNYLVNKSNSDLQISVPKEVSLYFNSIEHKDRIKKINDRVLNLKRCTRCILPSTHPFISFDRNGVCNYCNNYRHIVYSDISEFKQIIENIKSKYGENNQNCIVPLSGGRDSLFAIHKAVEFGLNPVAYTYDWGLVTDLARRNQSRACQRLGIEHIVISADIKKKRENVSKNVSSWLKNPDLGIIPLFMAGDKMFFTNANMLRKKLGIETLIFGMTEFENNDFKEGFCNVYREKHKSGGRFYHMDSFQQIKMMYHYFKEFVKTPSYFNSSVFDTMKAYSAYYLTEHDYTLLYKYYPWNEKEIEETIISEYNFELSPDTESTWRIGDGTAAFYNYIYYSLAGFSESEPMRSNQIREGQITREEGLILAERDNKPRYESLVWYCETIGLDPLKVIKRIDSLPFVENKWQL